MSYGSRKRKLWPGGVDLPRLRRTCITSSPSQTLRRRLVRTTATDAAVSARLDAVRRGFILHTSRLVRFHCRPVCSVAIFVQNRVFCLPHLHSTPPLGGGGSRRDIAIPFGREKLEWLGYPKVKKIRRYLYSFWRNSRTWQTDTQTDRHTDTAWRHRLRLCIASRGKNVKHEQKQYI